MKTLMITGAAGFLGSHLCEEALNKGFKVIGVDNFFRGQPEYLPHHTNFIFEEVDLLNIEHLKDILKKHRPTIIVHYAAINGTEYFYERPWDVSNTNISSTMNIVKALEELSYFPKKLVYASSSEVYGERPRRIPTNEDDLVILDIDAVRDSYASSKAIGEFIVKNFCCENELEYLIFRIFNTYGPKMDTSKYGQVVPEFISKAINGGEFGIIGNGQHTRSFCFVEDHARMAMQLIETYSNQVLNVGDKKETKIVDLASIICKIVKIPFNPIFLASRKNDPLRRCPDISKLLNLVKGPQYSLQKGLEKTVNWYLEKLNADSCV